MSKNLAKKIFYALSSDDSFPQGKGLVADEWRRFKEGKIAIIDDVLTEVANKQKLIKGTKKHGKQSY